MKIYIVQCYARGTDRTPCLIQSYKRKAAAIARKSKAILTFEKVDILETNY